MSAPHHATDAAPTTTTSRRAEGSVLGVAQAGVVVALLAVAAGAEMKVSAATSYAEKARRLAVNDANPYLVAALGGEAGHAAFRRPTRVRAWRVGRQYVEEGQPVKERLHGYEVLGGPVDLTGARARAFVTTIEAVTFGRESNKRCGFNPGVVVRWEDDMHALDVLLCFSCRDLQVMLDGKPAQKPAPDATVLYDFTRQREAFLAAARAVFPDDEALR